MGCKVENKGNLVKSHTKALNIIFNHLYLIFSNAYLLEIGRNQKRKRGKREGGRKKKKRKEKGKKKGKTHRAFTKVVSLKLLYLLIVLLMCLEAFMMLMEWGISRERNHLLVSFMFENSIMLKSCKLAWFSCMLCVLACLMNMV